MKNLCLAKRTKDMNDLVAQTTSIMLFGTLIAIIISIIVVMIMSSAILKPLSSIVKFFESMAKGDLSNRIKVVSRDEFGILSESYNAVSDALTSMVNDAGMLSVAGIEGRLTTRADASKHQGDFKKIIDGVNLTLDAVIGPLNVTAKYVDDISKGIIPPIITDTYNGDFNIIKNNLNSVVKMMSDLLKETDNITKAAADGELDKRANADIFLGGWNKLVAGVNDTIKNIVDPLMVTADYVDKISKGVIPPEITTVYKGQYNIIKTNLNAVVKMMSDLLKETDIITKAAADGEIDKRANANMFLGGWNKLVSGVNDTITNIVNPLMVTADYVDQISKGIIPPEITTVYKGQYNIIKINLNAVVKMMADLLKETDVIIKGAADGELDKRANANMFLGGWNKLVSGVNDTITNIVNPLMVTADYVDQISKGVIPPEITTVYKGQYNIIKINLNALVKMMSDLLKETDVIIKAAADGELKKRANADMFLGGWNKLVSGVNDTITNIVNPLMVTADYVDKIAKGTIPEKITDIYKGDYNIIKNNLNQCIDAVNLLVADTGMLAKAVTEGKVATRADAKLHNGDYRRIIEGVNQTLDLICGPLNETLGILNKMAEGDMMLEMKGDYKGDFLVLKNSVNNTLSSINEILTQVNTAIEQVTAGAGQVSQASQSLSQGAAEQASSLEEITSSITEINTQTKQNTENAVQVNGLAKSAKDNAAQGNLQMAELVKAMSSINISAENIKKIVKAIDDIAFQINLLALNANVEAARAGKYGKGFAVVADEVRNLAVRSASSVKETNQMVEEAIKNIGNGNDLVTVTAKQLAEIVDGASKVADLAEEVATASKEQSQGLEQVSTGLGQIDDVTQANTANAEESASAAEELASQSMQLKEMIAKFKLKAVEGKVTEISAEMLQMIKNELGKGQHHQAGQKHEEKMPLLKELKQPIKVNPKSIIALDDGNFGKF